MVATTCISFHYDEYQGYFGVPELGLEELDHGYPHPV
jgi:hypothetical protein